MIEAYLDELGSELGNVGIRGRLRRRILAESEDHLRSDPDAVERFGAPAELANAFAAELGARASRRAAVGAFLALGVAGAVYALSFVGAALAGQSAPDTWPVLAQLALPVAIVAPQVAFVAGSLALVRALRRREKTLPSAELSVLNRRTGRRPPVRPRDDGRARADRVRAQARRRLVVGRAHVERDGSRRDCCWCSPRARLSVRLATDRGRRRGGRPLRRPRLRRARSVALCAARARSASGSSSSSPRPSRAIRSTAPSTAPRRRSRASRALRRSAAISACAR